jgi:polysaccharide deacetylase family protein (PEP-CTERM system associated)
MPSRVEGQVDRLLDLFDETESRATFFALGWVAERRPALLRRIRDRGHEIASHGYGHELVYEIGPERFREDVRRSRAVIEDAIGERVLGYRAPSFSITKRSLWALQILAEEGFEYDSSIFPTRHPRYGIPGFARQPVQLGLEGGRRIVEFPLSALPLGVLSLPIAGGGYLRLLPSLISRLGWSRLDRLSSPSVLYLHPWEIDPDQPRQAVSKRVQINHYFNLGEMVGRVGSLVSRLLFSTMRDSLARWSESGNLAALALTEGSQLAAARPN